MLSLKSKSFKLPYVVYFFHSTFIDFGDIRSQVWKPQIVKLVIKVDHWHSGYGLQPILTLL